MIFIQDNNIKPIFFENVESFLSTLPKNEVCETVNDDFVCGFPKISKYTGWSLSRLKTNSEALYEMGVLIGKPLQKTPPTLKKSKWVEFLENPNSFIKMRELTRKYKSLKV